MYFTMNRRKAKGEVQPSKSDFYVSLPSTTLSTPPVVCRTRFCIIVSRIGLFRVVLPLFLLCMLLVIALYFLFLSPVSAIGAEVESILDRNNRHRPALMGTCMMMTFFSGNDMSEPNGKSLKIAMKLRRLRQ